VIASTDPNILINIGENAGLVSVIENLGNGQFNVRTNIYNYQAKLDTVTITTLSGQVVLKPTSTGNQVTCFPQAQGPGLQENCYKVIQSSDFHFQVNQWVSFDDEGGLIFNMTNPASNFDGLITKWRQRVETTDGTNTYLVEFDILDPQTDPNLRCGWNWPGWRRGKAC